jgi:Cu/Ag efflux pump CusA
MKLPTLIAAINLHLDRDEVVVVQLVSTAESIVASLKRRYLGVLPRLVARPGLAMGIVAGGLLLSGIGYAGFKDQFLPDFRETDFLMHFVEKPGIGIEAMDRITIRASKELRAIPGVRNFGAHMLHSLNRVNGCGR